MAKWIKIKGTVATSFPMCSNCKKTPALYDFYNANYCPNCGEKIEGKGKSIVMENQDNKEE